MLGNETMTAETMTATDKTGNDKQEQRWQEEILFGLTSLLMLIAWPLLCWALASVFGAGR